LAIGITGQPTLLPALCDPGRRARRAKSDGIDAEFLLRTSLAWLRGEPRVCSMVPTPTEADEYARRCVRERSELVAERISFDAQDKTNAQLKALNAFWTMHFRDKGVFLAAYDEYRTLEEFAQRLEYSLRSLIERRIKDASSEARRMEFRCTSKAMLNIAPA
jgi:hypothetical protein